MDLSVVIINWNSGDHLNKLLDSLKPVTFELDEIIVVDNNSDDGSAQAVAGRPHARLIANGRNLGFAGAANQGIRESASSFVLLLNPDIQVWPDALCRLYSTMISERDVAILGGGLRDALGRSQTSFQVRPFPSPWGVLKDVLFIDELLAIVGRGPDAGSAPPGPPDGPPGVVEIEQPAAAFWLLRKEAWEVAGGFDERFWPAWFEDVDFCKVLRGRGWRILFDPSPHAVHHGGLSLERMNYGRFSRIYYGNLCKYLNKHHRCAYPWLWIPIRIGIVLRVLFLKGRRRF